jgi:hypothetical protein
VRRADFQRAGGFDAQRYPRPQIEDIALGYRLRSQGRRVLLRPDIQATHLKRWTLAGMVRSDLFDRGVPWLHLLMDGEGVGPGTLNIRPAERVLTGLAGLAVGLLAIGAVSGSGGLLALAALCFGAVAAGNASFFHWLAGVRGPAFAVRAVPLQVLHYLLKATSVPIAAGQRLLLRAGAGAAVAGATRPDAVHIEAGGRRNAR